MVPCLVFFAGLADPDRYSFAMQDDDGDGETTALKAAHSVAYHTEETAFDRAIASFKSGVLGVLYISKLLDHIQFVA